MSDKILVDSSALIAYFISQEEHHQKIRKYVDEHPDIEWVVLSTVFSELITWLRAQTNHSVSLKIGEFLKTDCEYLVLSDEHDDETRKNFKRFLDKEWSYTDCSLLTLSKYLNIPHVLTLDHHFRQMKNMGVIPCPDE